MSAPKPELTHEARISLMRARWAVIQTGLITSGLALFGVYVLANRINEEHVMNLYIFTWVPAGAWVVGTIAGSGYAIASWWSGIPVRRMLLAVVLLLQSAAYFAGHYGDLQSMGLVYRDTRDPVSFIDYFHQMTLHLGARVHSERAFDEREVKRIGYAVRALEFCVFLLGAAASALMLVGAPRCRLCRGAIKQHDLGAVSDTKWPQTLARLEHFAKSDNSESFTRALSPMGSSTADITVQLCRCKACGSATIDLVKRDHPKQRRPARLHTLNVSRNFAEAILPPIARPAHAT